MANEVFPYAGRDFTVNYGGEIIFRNSYSADGSTIEVEFLAGEMKGQIMSMPFSWQALPEGIFLIWWQEEDKSTIVHCDDFYHGKTKTFYTKTDGSFYVLDGVISYEILNNHQAN
jgi:uncharacterized protein YigE (DUF2233 family)